MATVIPLRALAAFEATARHSSMARASSELGVSASAISQQVKWLENHVQRQLFLRSKRPMVLSEAGERLFDSITGPFAELSGALDRLEPSQSRQRLSLRTPPSFTSKWLLGVLGDYRRLKPDLELRIEATNEYINFDWSEFDLDIRIGKGDWPGLYAQPLLEEEFMPLCTPSMRQVISDNPQTLLQQTLIHSEKAPVSWSMWMRENDMLPDRSLNALRFDRSMLSIEAATKGYGVAMESGFLARQELEQGVLVPALTNTIPISHRQHWIICPYQRLRYRK